MMSLRVLGGHRGANRALRSKESCVARGRQVAGKASSCGEVDTFPGGHNDQEAAKYQEKVE